MRKRSTVLAAAIVALAFAGIAISASSPDLLKD